MQSGWLQADARLLGSARRPLRAQTRVRLRSMQALFGWGDGGRASDKVRAMLVPLQCPAALALHSAPAPSHLPDAFWSFTNSSMHTLAQKKHLVVWQWQLYAVRTALRSQGHL